MDQSLASVFKAYDIRGLSPEQVDASFARRFGQVIADIYHPARVCVGRDMRSTSDELERALVEGLTASGVDVTLIGLCTTPVFNVTIGLADGKYDLGIMVTASHNPGVYNGFKMTDKTVMPIGQGNGMEEIRDRFFSDAPFAESAKRGTVEEDPNAITAYLDKVFSFVDVSLIAPMKIAIDAGNGMAGVVMDQLKRRIPQVEILPLYWEPDGNFPHHEANPLKSETMADVSALVLREGCACGVAFDGDCDRIGFVDENGEQVRGDILGALLAKDALARVPGSRILRDIRCGWIVDDIVREAGGTLGITRVGHAFIKSQMRADHALFGAEQSMHFYFSECWGAEASDLAMLKILSILSNGETFSGVCAPLRRYANSGEINTKITEDKDVVLKRITDRYAPEHPATLTFDGIRMDFHVAPDGTKGPDAWWFSVRPSNTEPLLRLVVEAVSNEVMEKRRDEILAMIRG